MSSRIEGQTRLIAAALAHVPFDGWTDAVLAQAARELGEGADFAARMFPGGPAEAVESWSTALDAAMLERLTGEDFAAAKTRDKVTRGVRARLELLAPHREAVRRSLGLMALPHNAPRAARMLWRTVDAIWRAAGDRATDFNHYSKRALLAGVYGSTLLVWLDDRGEDQSRSWTFLDRRIADALAMPKALSDLAQRLRAFAPRPLRS